MFLVTAAAGIAAAQSSSVPESIRNLRPMTDGIEPITDQERQSRVDTARRLMRDAHIDALICPGGTSAFYFTATPRNETSFIWVLPAKGEPAWFVANADLSRAHQVIRMGGAIREWPDALDPYSRIGQFLKERGAETGHIGIEERTRFAIFDGLRKALPEAQFVSADPVTVGCRVIKSPTELVLMQRANDITIEAYRAALATLHEGMTPAELRANISAAYTALGTRGEALIGFGKYTAFPHGSVQPQQLREGDLVLVDDGCSIEGYQSDITRTVIFGKPTDRQRTVWDLELKAQNAALAAAKVGAACESVDAAARKVITDAGFGPGYKVPGLPHRTGHGIGLDGHEWTYLVKGNKTRLQPGMCFSNEPTIAIYGEFGVRLEDCMYVTEAGARMFTKQSRAIDQPFG